MRVASKKRVLTLLTGLLSFVMLAVMVLWVAADRGAFDPRAPQIDTSIPPTDYLSQPMIPANKPMAVNTLESTNCRYGVANVRGDSLAWVSTLDAGWFINFTHTSPRVNSAEFVPLVSVKQVIQNGIRQPRVNFFPPLSYYYVDSNNRVQPGLGTLISQNPGQLWLVGNEPDVDNQIQGNTMPDVYARAYHEAYHFIKQADPTARVAIGGLSMMTPGRLQYLDIVWDTYRSTYGTEMPVDVWNLHLYILEERNPNNPKEYGDGKIALGTDPALAKLTSFGDSQYCPALGAADIPANDPRLDVYCRSEHDSVRIFREQIIALRQWMKDKGQQDKPLILTEFGLLYPYLGGDGGPTCEFLQDENQRCFNPARVSQFMSNTMAFLENTRDTNLGYPQDDYRLVQQWLWFSVATGLDESGGSSNLVVDSYQSFPPGSVDAFSLMGQTFRQEANSFTGTSNLAAGTARNFVGFTTQPTNTGTAILTVDFRNSGIQSITEPFTITFYFNRDLTSPIGSVVYDPNNSGAVTGCTWDERNPEQVTIRWENLMAGEYQYWVKIDSTGLINETNENDNVISGRVSIQNNGLFIPIVNR